MASLPLSLLGFGLDPVPGNLELMEFEHETPQALARGLRPEGGMFFERLGRALV